jgi:hypothetical protein
MSSPKLSESDAFWLKAETPTMPSRWAMGMHLADGAPAASPLELAAVREHVRARLAGIPWLSWRISGRGRRPGRFRWVDTAPVPLDRLVRLERLDPGRSLDDHLGWLVMQPLDRGLPPWRLRLVDGGDGTQGLVLDGHHAFAGGFTVVEMLDRLLGTEPPTAPPSPPFHPAPSVPRTAEAADLAYTAAAALRRRAVQLLPVRAWAPANAGAPLVGPIRAGRRIVHRELPLERIEAIGSAHGAGVTRVVLALIGRALDEVVPDRSVPRLRALFPRGTQEGPVTGPGNASRSTFLDLPLHLPMVDRLAALKQALAENATAGPQAPAVVDVVVSFQPLTPDLSILGREITGLTTSAPLRVCSHPLTRLTVVVQRYRRSMFVSFTADAVGFGAEVDVVANGLVTALDEYEAASTAAAG